MFVNRQSFAGVFKRPARDACLCMGELQAPPAAPPKQNQYKVVAFSRKMSTVHIHLEKNQYGLCTECTC